MPGDAQWSILHALARVLEQQFSGGNQKLFLSGWPQNSSLRKMERGEKKKVLSGIFLEKGHSGEPSIN